MLEALRSKKVLNKIGLAAVAVILIALIATAGNAENKAPTAKASAETTSGTAPLKVSFSSKGTSDPEKDELKYSWSFGDGTTSTQANPTKTYTKEGTYTATLRVSDQDHTATAKSITIEVDAETLGASTPPAATQNGGQSSPNTRSTSVVLASVTTTVTPTATFTANATSITLGESAVLQWAVTGTSPLCTASGAWNGSVATTGNHTVTPTETSTYTLTCTNGAGSVTQSVTVTVTPPADTFEGILNASMVEAYDDTTPQYWVKGSWGANTTVFGYETTGRTDARSVSITMSDYVSGDAKWIFDPVAVTGDTAYAFSDWYKSTAETEIVVDYTLDDGTHSYVWMGAVAPAADWTKYELDITTPANATHVTVHHVLKANGTLQLDDYNLVAQ